MHPLPRSEETLEPLTWDTQHFGFPVSRITSPDLDDVAVRLSLEVAKARGDRLVYWAADRGRTVPEQLLHRFSGVLVDERGTFVRNLPADGQSAGAESASTPEEFRIREYPAGPPSPRLIELALAAGELSRFNRDPSIDRGTFERLYETWIRRSTDKQIADAVLVADAPSEDVVGMVTVRRLKDSGRIGLIAVLDSQRGRGLGRLLLSSAHRWMQDRGVTQAVVVTQLDNSRARELYQAAGYSLANAQHVYHFWPQRANESA